MPGLGNRDAVLAASARQRAPGVMSVSRIAIISDIHANLPALEAVLAHADARAPDAMYHAGDLVGYAPWADETVALIRDRGIQGVAGNYDSTVATGHVHCGCRYEDARQEALSHESYAWTLANVRDDTRRYLGTLGFRLDLAPLGGHATGPRVVIVHGTPTLNTLYWTADRPDSFCAQMASLAGMKAGDAIVFGHTHVPWQRTVDRMHFVNAGSVGRPKDGDPRASYVELTIERGAVTAEVLRVEYDVARTARTIRASSLPGEFATFLETGGARY